MLAYVFWHWPAPAVDPARYEESITAFHRALAAAPPRGFRGSRVYAVEGAPFLPVASAFEDWYLLDDFAALGTLNEAAVSGVRREPHDAAARWAGGGHGGLYRLLTPVLPGAAQRTTWCSKPAGTPYAEFVSRLPSGEAWQRQLVLGPAPEFCIIGADARGAATGVSVAVRQVYRFE